MWHTRVFLFNMLVKGDVILFVMPGVNFTNILQAAFTRADPKSAKKTVKLSSFFCAFGICARKSCS